MKKRNFRCFLMIVLCIGAWMGYRTFDSLRTDQIAPEIQVQDTGLILSVQDPRDQLLQGISAVDDRDGDVTDSLIVERIQLVDAATGKISATVAAFDNSGNVAKAVREATFEDYSGPRMLLQRAMVYTQGNSFDPLSAFWVWDKLDGDITHRVRATSMDDSSVSNVGVHQIEFRVTNSLGDTTKLVLPVEVVPAGTYNAQLELTDYMVYLKKGQSFNERAYLGEFRYGSSSVTLGGGLPAYFSLKTYGSVNNDVPGVYSLAYKVTYDRSAAAGYTSEDLIGYSRLIVVVEE